MKDKLWFNNAVSEILGLKSRQVISWTEKGLTEPEKPARKAGKPREYSYNNLLELGLAKYLLDTIGLQFFTVREILRELREDGEIVAWATNYSKYRVSFSRKIKNKDNDLLSELTMSLRVGDPRGLGGTMDCTPDTSWDNLAEKRPDFIRHEGTLYYIFLDSQEGEENVYTETMRIVSPWDIQKTLEAFDCVGIEEIITNRGMVIANLGQIKEKIDASIKEWVEKHQG